MDSSLTESGFCDLHRRGDGAVVVRVRSRSSAHGTLPDAVFAFRHGDPQYSYWERQLRDRERLSTAS